MTEYPTKCFLLDKSSLKQKYLLKTLLKKNLVENKLLSLKN